VSLEKVKLVVLFILATKIEIGSAMAQAEIQMFSN